VKLFISVIRGAITIVLLELVTLHC